MNNLISAAIGILAGAAAVSVIVLAHLLERRSRYMTNSEYQAYLEDLSRFDHNCGSPTATRLHTPEMSERAYEEIRLMDICRTIAIKGHKAADPVKRN